MHALRSLVVAVVAFVVLAVPAVVLADGRVALVVGNSTYAHIGRLPNPDNDARDMSAALQRLGFEVTIELNADRVELTEALRAFTRQSAGADVSLVFYAGHSIEMDGVNYLVPVDARLESGHYDELISRDDEVLAELAKRQLERARHRSGDRCAVLREVGFQRYPGSAIRQAVAVLFVQLPAVRGHGYPRHVQVALPMNVLSCFGRFASVLLKACRRRTASHPRTAVGDPVSNSKHTRSRN